jgi:nickel/cobalt transporter (NicO) family protein
MSPELVALTGTAAIIGFGHTLLGPDHYLPFVAMSKARSWSIAKTSLITFLCGVGHVASSVVLGAIGLLAGSAVGNLEWFEGFRGNVAAWLLTGFGLAYLAYGIRKAIRNETHTHTHAHGDGESHEHVHDHHAGHVHPHVQPKASITPWVLFTIFVFGPCEPLIPILMYPAATKSAWGVALVAGVFATVTIATMMATVLAATFGLSFVKLRPLARYADVIAGASITACGAAIHLGL